MIFNQTINELRENHLSDVAKIFMAVSLVCICVVGVLGKSIDDTTKRKIGFSLWSSQGNLTVLILAFRKQNYRFVTNCYIINLAITDLLFLLISVPLTTYLGLTNTWILDGIVSCRIYIYLAHVRHLFITTTEEEKKLDLITNLRNHWFV